MCLCSHEQAPQPLKASGSPSVKWEQSPPPSFRTHPIDSYLAGIFLALAVASTEHAWGHLVAVGLIAEVLRDQLYIHLLQGVATRTYRGKNEGLGMGSSCEDLPTLPCHCWLFCMDQGDNTPTPHPLGKPVRAPEHSPPSFVSSGGSRLHSLCCGPWEMLSNTCVSLSLCP